jgi:CHAD domain-containing protein/uncharacterized protein YjbK
MTEVEAKFLLSDPAQTTRLIDSLKADQVDVQPLTPVDVVDRYLDTPDWQVFRAGWAYRWRDTAGERTLGLKSVVRRDSRIQTRDEVEQAVAAFPDEHDRVPGGPVAEQLNDVDQRELRELFQVHNHRQQFNIRTAQGALIELAIDHATITATAPHTKLAPGRLEFDELEMELKEGTEQALRQLAGAVQERFGLRSSRLSKFERGWQTAGLSPPWRQQTHDSPDSDLPLGVDDPVITLAYRFLREQFQQVLFCEPRAWEGLDLEGVHQMRVATRRMRAAFRALKSVLPAAEIRELAADFKVVAAALGEVRDLDVYLENFAQDVAEVSEDERAHLADFQQHVVQQRQEARDALLACFDSPAYERLKQRFAALVDSDPPQSLWQEVGSLTIRDAASKIIPKRHKKVLRAGRAIGPSAPDDALHALRIDCKRLRYLLEFVQPVYGKSLVGFVRRLKGLQDLLGEFQDACVATQRLRAYAAHVPARAKNRGQLVALGQLIHSQRRRAADRRSRFKKAWKRFDHKGERKRLRELLAGPSPDDVRAEGLEGEMGEG